MKNTQTVATLATQVETLTQAVAALAQLMQGQATRETVPARKEAAPKASKKTASKEAAKEAHKARVATWNELVDADYADVIAVTAKRIIQGRKDGIINANINADDIRVSLTTEFHQQLRRATWKNEAAKISFTQVIADLTQAVAALSSRPSRKTVKK